MDGSDFISTVDGETANYSLASDVLHFSEYVGIRDRFRLSSRSRLELGVGLGHMAFDQNFDFNAVYSAGESGQYIEDLTTNYFGGELPGRYIRR